MSTYGEPPPGMRLLHGDLDLTIHGARSLPNMDTLSTLLRRRCLRPPTPQSPTPRRSVSGDDNAHHLHLHRHRHKPQPHGHHLRSTSDPYATVVVPPNNTLARTHVVRNSEAPDWSVRITLPLAHEATHLLFQVKDSDPFGSDLIGTASLPVAALLAAAEKPIVSQWLSLFRPDGRTPLNPDSAICISASFTPSGAQQYNGGVPAYFPPRGGCEVKLYQDAHVEAGDVQGVPGVYEPGRCWEDVCMAVLGAQHLVYVVGWSVNTRVRLLREAMSPEMTEKAAEVKKMAGKAVEEMTLGELLKYKSQEGVRICLLVWDDMTSLDNFFLRTGGVMRTGDEDTKKFFRHSSVICVLSPRYPSSVVGMLYTHHQKCLLVDTPASESSTRRITAFLGGLDLAVGRNDTPRHRLFEGPDTTAFHGDFNNPTFGADARGPRQPWHDMHCRLDGPAAYDVLKNFEQRWRKVSKLRRVFSRAASHWKDAALLKLERIPLILSPVFRRTGDDDDDDHDDGDYSGLHVLPEDDPKCWHAQVFRSVDSGSVKGFPRSWETEEMVNLSSRSVDRSFVQFFKQKQKKESSLWFVHALQAEKHLLCDKNLAVDQSIHKAYIRAIRSARRFIYIENQYFIGSSYAWPSYRTPGASNLVPMEIALKVASKIRAGEEFAAYIVIPMWPEGVPTSGPAQEILFWQSQTMQMMYEVIARAIQAMKLDGAHPQDYLNFYCLGKREALPPPGNGRAGRWPPDQPDSTNPAALARRHGRFMIYVHSKGMIVDDEYVIIGSANINQRSLAGSRDTEIAVGSYQPYHTAGSNGPRPRGQVYGYRMSLWEEHLGKLGRPELETLETPESPECVGLVNRIARDNWKRYTDEGKLAKLQGHLMRYPVEVRDDGKVGPLPGHEFFPDVGGRVLGSPSKYPDNLTM